MLESTIEKRLKKKVEDYGGEYFKLISPGKSGVPDRAVLLPGGYIYFVELKAPGKKPRPLQQHHINKLKGMGFPVRVIDSLEEVDKFIPQHIEKSLRQGEIYGV